MAFTLESVVPWGRSFAEYQAMFALTEQDLRGQLLGCADGPASFNAEASERGLRIVSCDPLYRFSAGEIERRVEQTYETVLSQVRANMESYVWDRIGSPEELGELRLAAMRRFLQDYERGLAQGRYVEAELPALPFADQRFDLALCSHFLLLYSGHLSLEFHRQSLAELLRVAREVRVFPIYDNSGVASPYLDPLLEGLREQGLQAELLKVPYEFQRGADQMLRVCRPS